jgi:phage/plasmid-associated DNA primase
MSSIIDFLNANDIKWFPINLVVSSTPDKDGKYKKDLLDFPSPLYKGSKPKMTDFEELDIKIIKARQTLVHLYDFIAIDTARIHHIDVDTPDCPDKYLQIADACPWFKSVSKSYGKHIFATVKNGKTNRDVVYKTSNGDVELLMGQWSYCRKDALVENADKNIPSYDITELSMITPNPKKLIIRVPSPTSITQMPQQDNQTMDKYTDLLLNYIRNDNNNGVYQIDRDESLKIATCLKTNGYNSDVFIQWAELDTIRSASNASWAKDLWERTGNRNISIYYLQNLCKRLHPARYAEWGNKYKIFNTDTEKQRWKSIIIKSFEKEIIQTYDEEGFAKLLLKVKEDELYIVGDDLYIYRDSEWRKTSKKDASLLGTTLQDLFMLYFETARYECHLKIEEAIRNQNEEAKTEKQKLYQKLCGMKIKNSFINNVVPIVKRILEGRYSKIMFDMGEDQYYNIHFKNGVYELNGAFFRPRTKADHITKYLDWDYVDEQEIPLDIQTDVSDFFKKIQPNEDQRNFTLGYLYYAITGDTTKQIFKMNVGHTASNGKSTELSIHEKCFDIYTKKLDKRVFDQGFEKRHKYIIDCFHNPIRLAYVEELSKKKLDKDFIKDWVDGRKVNCEVMFGTNIEMKPQAKLLSCSNYDPNFDNDNGIKRRGKLQHYRSQFVKSDMVNEANHKYLKVEGFENRFENVSYKNAYFHLLLKHKTLVVPQENEEEFANVVENNDEMLDFIEEHFEITGNNEDRELKKEIESRFGKEKTKQIIEKLKTLGCDYKKDIRKNNEKGVVLGILLKTPPSAATATSAT